MGQECRSSCCDEQSQDRVMARDEFNEQSQIPNVPFVVQQDRSLYFLTWDADSWTLAELEFDEPSLMFVEQRRSEYDWPREAFGALLSKFTGNANQSELERTAEHFSGWLGSQFQHFPSA